MISWWVCETVALSTLIFRFQVYAEKSKDELVALGFPQFTIEDFHDVVLNLSFLNVFHFAFSQRAAMIVKFYCID
jgi:hypothetical protein